MERHQLAGEAAGQRPSPPAGAAHPRLAATGRGAVAAFWALAAAVIVAYVFLYALGAFGSGEVAPLTALVVLFAVLWVAHGLVALRRSHGEGDQSG